MVALTTQFIYRMPLLFRFVSIGRMSVPLANILAINPQSSDSNNEQAIVASTATFDAVDADSGDTAQSLPMRKQFTIVYAKRSLNSTNLNKWRHLSITLHSTDAYVVDSWTRTLQNELSGKSRRRNEKTIIIL